MVRVPLSVCTRRVRRPADGPTINSPICDSYVRPAELVRICDECNFGTYGGRCIVCGGHGEFQAPAGAL